MTEESQASAAPAKVRKPRQKRETKAVAAPKAPLHLPKPTTSNGAANATLEGTVEKKFSRIALQTKDGKPVAIIHSTKDGEKAQSPGSATVHYIYAMVDAVLAGQGAGPDGSAMYAEDNWQKFVEYWGEHVKSLILICEPAGRAGAQGYIGSLDSFYQQARLKAQMVRASIKAFGASRPHQRTKAEKVETIEVRL